METKQKLKFLKASELCVGKIVLYRGKPNIILTGAYEIERRISNFWTWAQIKEDGRLGVEKKGYYDHNFFRECQQEFELRYIKK